MNWMVLSWCCRLLVGGVLLVSALGKSIDVPGFVDIWITYRLLSDWLFWPLALLIIGIEWILAAWILAAWHLSTGALSR